MTSLVSKIPSLNSKNTDGLTPAKSNLGDALQVTPALFTGINVTVSEMVPQLPEAVFERIKTGNNGLSQQIEHVRRLQNVDSDAAKKTKSRLPYFIGASFSPNVRKIENLVRIDYLVLDIDSINKHTLSSPELLKKEVITDPRVFAAFISPSGNGLKLVFSLSEPCFDHSAWKSFYISFATRFAEEYLLNDFIDKVCNDVTRICFLSFDPQLYYNPAAKKINWKNYLGDETLLFNQPTVSINTQNKTINRLTHEVPANDTVHSNEIAHSSATSHSPAKEKKQELSDEELLKIKKALNPNAIIKQEKQYYVPEEVEKLEQEIAQLAQNLGLVLKESLPIQYGKKLVFALSNKWCEINLFYGKKGYSAVITPKKGSDQELSETCKLLVENIIFGEKPCLE